jgi:hypothetical protein
MIVIADWLRHDAATVWSDLLRGPVACVEEG